MRLPGTSELQAATEKEFGPLVALKDVVSRVLLFNMDAMTTLEAARETAPLFRLLARSSCAIVHR